VANTQLLAPFKAAWEPVAAASLAGKLFAMRTDLQTK
jgi:hypothetical protein